jgi:hypothetical protein
VLGFFRIWEIPGECTTGKFWQQNVFLEARAWNLSLQDIIYGAFQHTYPIIIWLQGSWGTSGQAFPSLELN